MKKPGQIIKMDKLKDLNRRRKRPRGRNPKIIEINNGPLNRTLLLKKRYI